MYLDLLRCNRWMLYSQTHNSFQYHAQQRRDTVKLQLFPMAVYGAGRHTRHIIFPSLARWADGGSCSRSRTTFQSTTERKKLKFDVNQAGRALDVTGAFYSTSPSLFPFGFSAQLQLNVALFSRIKWNLPISHFMF